ncbi:hypothetical protein K1719_044662 [Acacia pycnantha]|nr:hypothetical protein K1719_044662 [Acacia pycnantha]
MHAFDIVWNKNEIFQEGCGGVNGFTKLPPFILAANNYDLRRGTTTTALFILEWNICEQFRRKLWPYCGSVLIGAPWILTVKESTINKTILATTKLRNDEEFSSESVFRPYDFPPTLLPLAKAPHLVEYYKSYAWHYNDAMNGVKKTKQMLENGDYFGMDIAASVVMTHMDHCASLEAP